MTGPHLQSREDRARTERREMCKAAFFKPTGGGYVYRAPNPYVFGCGKHYIVTEGQREAILEVLAPPATTRVARFARALGFGFIGLLGLSLLVCLLGLYTSRLPTIEYVVIALGAPLLPLLIALLAMTYSLTTLLLTRLQPILANAMPTDERITHADVMWSLQTSGDRTAQQRKAIIGGVLSALIAAALAGAAILSWPKYGGGFAYVQPVSLATFAALSLISTAAVLWRAVTAAGESSRAFDRALRRVAFGVAAIFIAVTVAYLGLSLTGAIGPNYTEMFERAEIAAANGDAEAMARLGWLHRDGKGVAQNYGKAQEWYEKSAAAGNTNAMVSLGVMFQTGLVGRRDYVKARAWFDQAAAAGNANAMDWIGFCYQHGLGVASDLAAARQWYQKAAAMGYGPAQHHLGMLYLNAWGVPQDYGRAREWFLKAAAAGHGASMDQLGMMSISGFGAAKDPAAARGWYEKAVSAGNLDGMQHLANMLDQGNGGPADQVRAAHLLLQSAERGHAWSRCVLAGPLSLFTPGTRNALKSELAKLGHDSGAIDDLWDDAARAAYRAYIKGAAQPVGNHTCIKSL